MIEPGYWEKKWFRYFSCDNLHLRGFPNGPPCLVPGALRILKGADMLFIYFLIARNDHLAGWDGIMEYVLKNNTPK